MFRIVIFASALSVAATIAQAQTTSTVLRPETCRSDSEESLPQLQERKQLLEHEIAAKYGRPAKAAAGDEAHLRKSQEELLQATFRIECMRSAQRQVETEPARRAPRMASRPAPARNEVIEV